MSFGGASGIKFGIANPCYKCGIPTKHKVGYFGRSDKQQAVCENCDPNYKPRIVGHCLKCKELVDERHAGWSGKSPNEILLHYTKGKSCDGKIKLNEGENE